MSTWVLNRSDGGVSILDLVIEEHLEYVVGEWEKSNIDGVTIVSKRQVDRAELPVMDEYRNAWTHGDQSITYDMPKARDIHRERIRARRAPLLAEQDLALMLVDEDETLTAAVRLQRRRAVIAKKKALRDAPADPRIEAAQTIDDLRAVDPLKDL